MKLLSTFFLLLLPFSLLAESGEWFVGLDAGATGAKLSNSDLNSSYAFSPEYGVKIGIREKNSRIYLGYTNASDIGTEISKTQSPYLALEGISNEFKVISNSTAKFFFGVRLGASFADINGSSTSAVLAGFQTGLNFVLPADFEIELAYRQYWALRNNDATDFGASAATLGLNYKFGAF